MSEIFAESSTLNKPQIRKYLEIKKYLADYYSYRKSENKKFNYDVWSAELGFKSRSFMYLICIGKRKITTQLIDKLSFSLDLNEIEKKHLTIISLKDKAKTSDLRSLYSDKTLESLQYYEEAINTENQSDFITSESMPLIKMLLAFNDFGGTEEDLLNYLKIPKETLKSDLNNLLKLNLIKTNGLNSENKETWKSTSKAFQVWPKTTDSTMESFHKKTLHEASEKVKQDILLKKFRTILFAIDEEKHTDLINEIELFITKIKNKFATNEIKNKNLIKLNLQAYNITNKC